MNEKSLKVLEQYEIEVRSVRKGRGSYVLDTDQGVAVLREYNGSRQRASWIQQVCSHVNEFGLCAELLLKNRDGSYIGTDRDGCRYLLKKWSLGKEMDVRDFKEISAAAENLAKLHNVLTGFEQDEWNCTASTEQMFDKRMREMRKIWRYVREKKRKNEFELFFQNEYGRYWDMCVHASELASQDHIRNMHRKMCDQGCVYHGGYTQHNVLKEEKQLVTVNFEGCRIGCQIDDLYGFMRKMLEKNSWNIGLSQSIMEAYMKQRPISKEELEQLYIQMQFSEKFWKISNHYYNSKKTWIPDRSLQKLERLVQQEDQRQAFLEQFYQSYLS